MKPSLKSLMKSKSALRAAILVGPIAALLATPSARAATLCWDGGTVNIGTDGNGVSGGTAGNWDTTLTNWDQGNALAHIAWNNANNDTAFLAGTAGAVTLTAPVTVGGLTFFGNSGYSIAASTQGLSFGATNNTIGLINQTGTTTSATISGTVAGNNLILTSISPTIASTLNFTGATAGGWTGTTTVGPNMNVTLDGAASLNRNLLNTTGITLNAGAIDSGIIANNANGSADRINNAANWTVNSGTFIWGSSNAGGTYRETLGTVTLNSGPMNFVLRGNLTSGSQELTLGTSGVGLSQTGTSVVTFSNTGSSLTTAAGNNRIRVNGITTSTPANRIIGPWATVGSAANSQNDFAKYTSDGTYGYVVAAGLTDTAEASWVNSTTDAWSIQPGTSNTTADHIAAAVKVYGGAGTWTLNNLNLQTGGIFFSGSSAMTIAGSGANGVITALPGGGNLYITAGQTDHIISAPINDPITGGGSTTLVVSGAGRKITLSSATSNYSGGTVVNSGTLFWSSNANLGLAGSRNITVNGNASLEGVDGTSLNALAVGSGGVANFIKSGYFFVSTTGSGVISHRNTGGAAKTLGLGNASGFTGTVQALMGGIAGAAPVVQFSSIADTAGSALQIGGGNSDPGQTGNFLFNGSASLTFNNRRIEILSRTSSTWGANAILTNNSAAGNIWVINTDLSYLSDQNRDLRLNGTNTGNNAFNGVISNGNVGGTVNLVKLAGGTWNLGGANTYTGSTTVSGGTLQISTLANGGSNSSIGASTNAVGNLILNSGTLRYTGGSGSTDRNFALMASSTIDASGTTALNFSQTGTVSPDQTLTADVAATKVVTGLSSTADLVVGMSVTGTGIAASSTIASIDSSSQITLNNTPTAGTGVSLGFGYTASARTLTLTGTNTDANTIAGRLQDTSAAGAGVLNLAKTGIGAWVLGGANTMTGTTNLSGGGTLVLDYSTQDNSKLADAAALTLGRGTLTLKGATGSHVEVVTSTSLNAGGTFLTRDVNGGANTLKLRMNAITRAAGGTISFGDATIADTDTNNINSILGGWATLGNDWAVSVAAGAADTAVTALASYTGTLPQTTGANTGNYTLTGPQNQNGSVLANTVKITGTGTGDTLALAGNNLTITYASATSLGGILYTGGGDGKYNITGTGKILTSTTTGELIINTVTGTLTTSAPIVATGATAGILTKTGAGTLAVNVANSYTGATNVNQGVLRLMNATASGSTAGGIVVQNGAALELANGAVVGAETLTITGGGVSNAGALRNVASNTSSYAGAITIGTGGARINSDSSGALTLSGGVVTSLFSDVSFGGAGNTTVQTVAISGAGAVIKDGAGTVALNFANSYTGGTFINQGTVQYGVINALADTGAVTVGGGIFDIQTFSDTVGTVTLASGSIIGSTGVLTGTSYAVQSGTVSANLAGTGVTMTKTTSGSVTLSGTNTYTGGTFINQGTIQYGGINALADTGAVTVGGGIFDIQTFSDTVGAVTLTSGSITGTTGVLTGTSYAVQSGTASANLAGTGVTMTKTTSGSVTLSGTNTYTGATTVSAGKLTISSTGTINNTSGVSIGAGEFNYNSSTALSQAVSFSTTGGTLSGSGTITPAVSVTAGNTLAPGNSIGTLSFGTGLTLAGNYAVELGAPGSSHSSVGNSDATAITGSLALGGSLTLTDNANVGALGSVGAGSYRIATYTTTSSGSISNGSITNPAGLHFTVSDGGAGTGSGQGIFLDGYRFGAANAISTPVSLGNLRVGGTFGTSALSIQNTAAADTFSEGLDASGGTPTGHASTTGSISNLPAGATDNTSVLVGLGGNANTGTAGAKTGTVPITLATNGTGTSGYASTALTGQTVTVNGGVYDFANPTLGGVAFGNVRTSGTAATQNLSVQNATVTNASFQDSLDVALSGTTTSNGAVTVTPQTYNLLSGAVANTSIQFSADRSVAGSLAGSKALTLTSNANGVSGLSNADLSTTVNFTGGAYDLANANYTGAVLAFGTVHAGASVASQTVAFGNQTVTNASFQDALDVSATTGNAKVTATGFTGLLASGGDNLTFAVNTATAGSLASTASLTLTSNANGVPGLSNGTATVVGGGTITTTGGVYSGNMKWSGGSGSWNTGSNWTDSVAGGAQASPGLDAGFTNVDSATFGNTAGSVTVNLSGAAPMLNAVTFDGTGDYTVTGATVVTLQGASPSITVSGGTQAISAPVALGSNLAVAVTAGTLNVNGAVSGGFDIAKSGGGTLNFGATPGSLAGVGNLTATAGTTNVNSVLGNGTSAVSVTGATTLKFGSVSQTLSSLSIGAGSTVTFTSGVAAFSGGGKAPSLGGSAVVPEPGTIGLLLVGALGLLNRRRRQE
ncbi:MAG: autotransporter-associated beta strand repeat-containing protein [Chthoniobacter sp.]|nr:autotransporter-associated beta strand repeat-containing protein [Chthoniobacter sp.]